VKSRAFGEHPAGEDTLDLARELDLIHLDEGRGIRWLGRRARVADPRRNLEGTELHGVIDRYLEMGDAAGDLVEGREHGDRILDLVGAGKRGRKRGRNRHKAEQACGEEP
jgi:hypothetical protein